MVMSTTMTARVDPGTARCARGSPGYIYWYIYGPKPYEFIGFGDIYGPKPYKFMRFGDIYGPKPYGFIGFGASMAPNPMNL